MRFKLAAPPFLFRAQPISALNLQALSIHNGLGFYAWHTQETSLVSPSDGSHDGTNLTL